MAWLEKRFEPNVFLTTVDHLFNWARKSSVWPMTFGLACCFVEFATSATARFDLARFGSEVMRPSPRQSDLMVVAGTLTLKMAPVVKRLYAQMPDPKWVMAMGSCAMTGGPFNTYSVVQGVDRVLPVDVYVVGCPPRPENFFYGLLRLQDRIDQMSLAKRPTGAPGGRHARRFPPPGASGVRPATERRSCGRVRWCSIVARAGCLYEQLHS